MDDELEVAMSKNDRLNQKLLVRFGSVPKGADFQFYIIGTVDTTIKVLNSLMATATVFLALAPLSSPGVKVSLLLSPIDSFLDPVCGDTI